MSTGGRVAGDARTGVAALLALAITANAVGQGFSRFSYPVLLPDMRDDVLHSYGLAGLLGTVNLVSYLACVICVSLLSGRVSSTKIVCAGLATCSVGSAVLAVAPGVPLLVLGMILTGGGAAGTWVPLASVVSAAVDIGRRGIALGAVTGGFGVGVLLAGQLRSAVYALAGEGSWRTVWAIEAGMIAVAFVAFVLWFRPPAEASAGRIGGPLATLRAVPGWGRLTVAYTSLGLGYIVYASFLTALLEEEAGYSASHASTVFSLIGITSIAGALVVGRVADRVGQRRVYVLATGLLAVCAVLVLARSEPWTSLSAAAFGLPLTATGVVVVMYLGDHLRGAAISTALGAITVVLGVALAAGPWIGGVIADSTGSFTATFLTAAAALALSAAAAYTLPHGRQGAVPEEMPRSFHGSDRSRAR